MDSIDQTQQTLDESARDRYKAMAASEKKNTSENQTNSGVMLSRAVTSVSISSYGRKVDEIHRELENIEDPEERRKATEGMRKAMIHTAGKTDASETVEFIESVGRLKEKDEAAFTEVFRTAGALSEGDQDIGQWMDALLRIEDPEAIRSFVAETSLILDTDSKDEALRLKTINQFVTTVSSILDARFDKATELGLMEQLFEGIASTEGLEARNTFMNLYVEENLK
jgi:hypothetical protein